MFTESASRDFAGAGEMVVDWAVGRERELQGILREELGVVGCGRARMG